MSDEVEHPLSGGWVTGGVVRVGQTVRRPRGSNAAFVEALLRHLDRVGFGSAPRYLGVDERGRDAFTYIEGSVPSDCRSIVWRDDQLRGVASLLRAFHDATEGSELAADAEVVCHNDFGPWNLVWRDDLPIGIIDFDNAAPGSRQADLGYAAWKALNLGLIDPSVAEQRRRLELFVAAYGAELGSGVLEAIGRAQERMQRLILDAPIGADRERALAQHAGERAWLEAHGRLLVD